MTVEDGHAVNIDGRRSSSFHKYKPDDDFKNPAEDRVSVLSGASFGGDGGSNSGTDAPKLPWYKGVTCHDVRAIMPTVLILIGGLLIMIFVIPYAFSSVIKQLQAEELLEQRRQAEEALKNNQTSLASSSENES